MSWQAQSYVERLTIKSTPQKLILVYLAKHVNEEGYCWPSQATLAKSASISERGVRDHLANMERGGLIIRTMRRKDNGYRNSDMYEIVGFRSWLARMNDIDVSEGDAAARRSLSVENAGKNPTGGFLPVGGEKPPKAVKSADPTGRFPPNPTGRPLPGNLQTESSEVERVEIDKNKPASQEKGKGKKATGGRRAAQGKLPGTEPAGEQVVQEESASVVKAITEAQYQAYVKLAKEVGLPLPSMLTASRRRAIEALRREFGPSAWDEALTMLRASPCLWENQNRSPIRFDEFIFLDKFVLVREGRYTNGRGKPGGVGLSSQGPNGLDIHVKPREWRARMQAWESSGRTQWVRRWGPPPGADDCAVPAEILEECLKGDAA